MNSLVNKIENRQLQINQVISSIDTHAGGPSYNVTNLMRELVDMKCLCNITTIASKTPLLKDVMNEKNCFIKKKANYLNLRRHFKSICLRDADVVFHGHGIWQTPVHAMAKMAKKYNIPYVISPRGMLEPWALHNHKWGKKIILWSYQYSDLAYANCIHATAQIEANNIRNLGFKNPIAIIPNGVNLSEFPQRIVTSHKEKRTLLFLSRIHPKKGIELLVEAWSKLDNDIRNNWQVKIVGNGEKKYLTKLLKLIENKKLIGEIFFIGPKFGIDKVNTYHEVDLFILPTYSENFGNVIIEALSCGLPVITTKNTPWEELNLRNAGWWIDLGIDQLVTTLNTALKLTDIERQQMGYNGRKLVEESYSIEIVAEKMIQLYEWMLNRKEKPNFVYTNEL